MFSPPAYTYPGDQSVKNFTFSIVLAAAVCYSFNGNYVPSYQNFTKYSKANTSMVFNDIASLKSTYLEIMQENYL